MNFYKQIQTDKRKSIICVNFQESNKLTVNKYYTYHRSNFNQNTVVYKVIHLSNVYQTFQRI